MREGEGYVVADAGGNAVVRASHKGTFTTIAALPPGSALAPPFLGLPPGTQIPTDAVPTSVVQGPDGAYYVTQLTGFPFEKGDANIWRVVPGQAPTVYASGLTNLTDLAFADDGSLYAVEIAVEGLLSAGAFDRRARQGHTRRQRARDHRRWAVRAVWRRAPRRGGLRHHLRGVRRRGRGHSGLARLTCYAGTVGTRPSPLGATDGPMPSM